MIKKIIYGLVALLLLAVIGFFIYINSGPSLPANTDKIVAEVIKNEELPELITGKTSMAKSDSINIWYERIGGTDTSKATVLLIMGHSASALVWSTSFYQPFLDAGYQVIRYDNRGVGESDWVKDWTKDNAYTLEDMAKDAIAVLDDAGVKKAHIIGASMGGMISQRLAISHSDRILSHTSIMSSGFMEDPSVDPIPSETMQNFTKLGLKYLLFGTSESNVLKFSIGVQQLLKGSGDYTNDVKKTAERTLYELRNRKGMNPKVMDQHSEAIAKSGSRLEELGEITVPTLVIHGKTDPLVIFQHGEKYAPLIPNAETLFIDGMGHDMPDIYMKEIHQAIFKNFAKAE